MIYVYMLQLFNFVGSHFYACLSNRSFHISEMLFLTNTVILLSTHLMHVLTLVLMRSLFLCMSISSLCCWHTRFRPNYVKKTLLSLAMIFQIVLFMFDLCHRLNKIMFPYLLLATYYLVLFAVELFCIY